jgi:CheY-like chemotaxis protein
MVAKRMVEKSWPQAIVDTASTGLDALAFIQKHNVDMVLMDMLMPDMDGLEVTRAIRQLPPEKCNLPVLGLTASSNVEDLANCLDAGMNDMVLKPLDIQALEKSVRMNFSQVKQT